MLSSFFAMLPPGKILEEITGILETTSKDFSYSKGEYTKAMDLLRLNLGDEKIDNLIDSITRRSLIDLFFCGSLGYEANLNNFRDPIARTFMDVDSDTYLRLNILKAIPERNAAETEIQSFRQTLQDRYEDMFSPVAFYLLTLEQDLIKFAHYIGFMLGNKLLKYAEPGYVPNLTLSLRYRNFMENYFGNKPIWSDIV